MIPGIGVAGWQDVPRGIESGHTTSTLVAAVEVDTALGIYLVGCVYGVVGSSFCVVSGSVYNETSAADDFLVVAVFLL